ncbi:MAG: zinc ribbon domain-containing protein [Armatimonadota bacterium]|nr:zinc ribbon domain-containing protein [Armatimonadota bacterium]MDR7452021.1 zinc ribbon domain-containing protein [Armatimonadota bacterium]MDR7467912.1 zinc ribbon domain-containing protein [Armatimonadota bacterium]MDR7494235.1 zinc ribbon domain-containing protein [Armatimonadota bacterium]MDR7500016.1 zinc ribbon domain-containing protein [Armatimonadota bacterium]
MPIYEYRCRQCRRRSSVLLLSYKERVDPVCPHCGSRDLARIMSRFATVRSEEARLESLADDPELADVDEKDPRSVARWMRKMGREFGDELGDDFESVAEEAAAAAESGDGAEEAPGEEGPGG